MNTKKMNFHLLKIILTLAFSILLSACKQDNVSTEAQAPKPAAPVLMFPTDSATAIAIRPTFEWQEAREASYYSLQISKNNFFTSNIVLNLDNLTATSYTADSLEFGTHYFWRVNSINDLGRSSWSMPYQFTTINRPNRPPLVPGNPSPSNNSVSLNALYQFSWTCSDPDNDSLQYTLLLGKVSPPSVFSDSLKTTMYFNTGMSLYNEVIPLSYSSTYYWKVNAVDQYGDTTISPIWQFSTRSYPWIKKASMPMPRQRFGATTVGNKIFVVGGNEGGYASNTCFEYDALSNTWAQDSTLHTSRLFPAVAQINGLIYAVGGYDLSNTNSPPYQYFATLEVYDPSTKKWSLKSPMHVSRSELMVETYNGRLFAMGGYANGDDIDAVEEYDPSSDRWIQKSPMPTPLAGGSAVLRNDKIYVMGSYTGAVIRMYVYNPANDAWTIAQGSFSSSFRMGRMVIVNNEIYVVNQDYIYHYDADANDFICLAPSVDDYEQSRVGSYGLASLDGKILRLGGKIFSRTDVSTNVEIIDPSVLTH